MSITYNSQEAKQEKKATVYENFTYDTESNGGCLDKFINLSKIIETVANDVHDLGTKYGTLQSKYGQFTDFNEKMNTNTNSLTSSIDAIRTAFDQIIKNLDSQVAYFSKQDASFMGDLDSINKMLTTGGQAATGGGGTSGGGGSAGGGGTSGGGGAPTGGSGTSPNGASYNNPSEQNPGNGSGSAPIGNTGRDYSSDYGNYGGTTGGTNGGTSSGHNGKKEDVYEELIGGRQIDPNEPIAHIMPIEDEDIHLIDPIIKPKPIPEFDDGARILPVDPDIIKIPENETGTIIHIDPPILKIPDNELDPGMTILPVHGDVDPGIVVGPREDAHILPDVYSNFSRTDGTTFNAMTGNYSRSPSEMGKTTTSGTTFNALTGDTFRDPMTDYSDYKPLHGDLPVGGMMDGLNNSSYGSITNNKLG